MHPLLVKIDGLYDLFLVPSRMLPARPYGCLKCKKTGSLSKSKSTFLGRVLCFYQDPVCSQTPLQVLRWRKPKKHWTWKIKVVADS